MDEDKEKAKRIAAYTIGQDLSELSVGEVDETITALEAEIARLKITKSDKTKHLSAAEALFKS